MNKTPIITINNLYDGAKSIKVKNFSDTNVREAVGKLLDVDPKVLQCESSSMGGGFYSIESPPIARLLNKELRTSQTLMFNPPKTLVEVSYGDLYE